MIWLCLHNFPPPPLLPQNHMEAVLMECQMVYSDLITALRDLNEWMKPKPVEKNLINKLNTIYLQPEPYGTVLIISPWNYPFQLAILPLLGAIAAGTHVRVTMIIQHCVNQLRP